MFTRLALAIGFAIAFQVDRWNAADRNRVEIVTDDEVRTSILHGRQDLKLIAFLLGAILFMLGIIADRLP
jgi:hypothetical protein